MAPTALRPRAPVREAADQSAGWFIAATLACCIFLQRFGIPFGDLQINVVGPLGLGCGVVGLVTGRLALDRGRLLVFAGLLGFILLGSLVNYGSPDPFSGVNIPSTLQFVGITAFVVLTFAKPMEEAAFFRIVTRMLLIVAIAGIVQFAVQFVGVSVFQFSGILPQAILAETNWNLEIPIGFGSALKSNGFFLVEPSVMSQFMAMALMIEMLAFRRLRYLLAFAAGLALSFSGTGGIVLFAFVCVVAVRLGWRGLALATAMVVVLCLAAGLILLVAPDVATVAAGRITEFNEPGTSGHMRFITPFWLLSDMLQKVPSLIMFGLGGGVSEHLIMPYAYDVNTPVKIGLEYGFPALICYVLLFLVGNRSKLQSVLVVPGFVLLMFTGAYQQFAPVIYFVVLICSVARLKSTPTTSTPAQSIHA